MNGLKLLFCAAAMLPISFSTSIAGDSSSEHGFCTGFLSSVASGGYGELSDFSWKVLTENVMAPDIATDKLYSYGSLAWRQGLSAGWAEFRSQRASQEKLATTINQRCALFLKR
jgi:hypothetical protein